MGLPCDPMPGGLGQPCRSRIMAATCMPMCSPIWRWPAMRPCCRCTRRSTWLIARPRPAARAAVHLRGRMLPRAGGTGPQGRVSALVRREPPGGQASGQPDLTAAEDDREENGSLTEDLQYVGGSYPVHDVAQKVTGELIYGSDFSVPGMLHAKLILSTIPHGMVKRIDTSRAEAHAGRRQGLLARKFTDGPVLPSTYPSRSGPRDARRDAVQRARALRRRPRRRGGGDEPGGRRGGRGARRDRVRGAPCAAHGR